MFLPSDVQAQAAIAGVVKDSSGAALPGVTVEASSPALIERVRSAISDGAGNKVGTATDNLRTFSTNNARVYNGVDLNLNARIGASAFLLGGITHERSVSTTCDQRDNPNSLRFCDSSGPYRTLFKIAGSYELPYAIQVRGSFISRQGSASRRTTR